MRRGLMGERQVMKSRYLNVLLALGMSLMFVPLGSGYDGRNSSNGSSVDADAGAVVLGRNFKVRYGNEVTVKGHNLKVKFDAVLDDSRCPSDVTCVWGGDAKVVINVRQANAKASKIELHTATQLGQAGKYKQYVIKLVALDPYPKTSVKVKPSDYVATLLITKE